MTSSAPASLALAILRAVRDTAENDGAERGVSLPRLVKLLGQGASVLLRTLATLGDAPVAGQPGPGWVIVEQSEGRWMIYLTEAGAEALHEYQSNEKVP